MDAQGKQGLSTSDRILVLSAHEAEASGSGFWRAAERLGWRLLEYVPTGRALREIALTRPVGVIVLVGGASALDPCALLIGDLRRYQPEIPVVAVAEMDDEEAERRLRTAGATAYLAGASGGTGDAAMEAAAELIAAARAQREPPELVPRVYVGARSPPRMRGRRAPPRIRGQP